MSRTASALVGALVAALQLGGCRASSPAPALPAGLARLEREVSLQIAHARALNLNAGQRNVLAQAQRMAAAGEQAIAAGDYQRADQDFLRAKLTVRRLSP